MGNSVKQYLAKIGQKGGRSRSRRKLQAIRANLKKARAAKKARRSA